MTTASCQPLDVEDRARASAGGSDDAIYRTVANVIRRRIEVESPRANGPRVLADIGCGSGGFRSYAQELGSSYLGIDVVRYESLPQDVDFRQTDLDATRWPVPDELADITVAIETIEHLENPRAFVRELVRITTPAGLIVLSTPNQLSLLSKLSLLLKNQFSAFQERPGLYPAHRTALLEVDLVRIARECGLDDVQTAFTNVGRIPGTPLFWPAWLGLRGRAFSDNVILAARKGGTRSE